MRVTLVSSWEQPCGIAEHAAYLVEAVEQADPTISHDIEPVLHPSVVLNRRELPNLIVLNYQAGLMSQWQPAHIQAVRDRGSRVLCIYHDTGVPNSDQAKAICGAADAAIVHEPFDDLPEQTRYWRMGVPPAPDGTLYWEADGNPERGRAWRDQPTLGSIGFPFPWKHYDQLARVTAAVGWALWLIAPGATEEQIASWRALNPSLWVRSEFVERREAIAMLAQCDATAFTYVCHNTGQSAAILQGIAARKTVIALGTCRQFRALYLDPIARDAIAWCETFEQVATNLRRLYTDRVDCGIVALAEQESWAKVGAKYAALYRELGG